MTRRTARRTILVGLAAGLVGGVFLAPAGPASQAIAAQNECVVESAELRWGVKERFRNYISGSIANGEWLTEGSVSYETPAFVWQGGSGDVRPDLNEGTVTFPGKIHFTGHGGAMQLDLQDPRLEFTGPQSAQLVIDMGSVDTEGTRLALQPVVAAEVDISGASIGDGTQYSIERAPVQLTAEGAAAFNGEYGDYATGERLDPLDISFSVAGCAITASTGTAAPPVEEPAPGDSGTGTNESPEIPWVLVAVGGVAIIAIGVVTAMLLSGRKPRVDEAAQPLKPEDTPDV